MSQLIHTPGPLRIPEGHATKGVRRIVTENGASVATVHTFLSQTEANARLLAAAYNAFDSAAKKLGCNAVELAEAMQDGGIAELVEAAKDFVHDFDLGVHGTDQGHNSEQRLRSALSKIKGGAS